MYFLYRQAQDTHSHTCRTENPLMDNVNMIWRLANTYEREMYGIEFTVLEAPEELLPEDWEGPYVYWVQHTVLGAKYGM
ncbi:MAG TPA: hypothetical protein ENK25_03115 [Bacteroidetes bacterium]|nr:hypothetical protein [Bacteroidota bacterium]